MSRDDYLREVAVVSALRDYDKAVQTAEDRALAKLRTRGFTFTRIAEVQAFKRAADNARRANAERIALEAASRRKRA